MNDRWRRSGAGVGWIFCSSMSFGSINRKNLSRNLAGELPFPPYLSFSLWQPRKSRVCTTHQSTAFILVIPITRERERGERKARARGMGIATECKSPAFRKPRGYSGFAVDPITFIGAPSFFSRPKLNRATDDTFINLSQLNAPALHRGPSCVASNSSTMRETRHLAYTTRSIFKASDLTTDFSWN